MIESTDNGVDFELQEFERQRQERINKEKQMIRDKYLRKANDGSDFFDVLSMTPEDLKLHESHRPFKHNGDNRTGLQAIKDRQQLRNEYNYLNGRI